MSDGHNEELVAQLLAHIQNFVYPRRLRAKEYFLDHDKLNSGRCTINNFSRGLVAMNILLRDEEVAALAEHFTEHGPHIHEPQVVNYVKFCAAVDQVFSKHGETTWGIASIRGSPSDKQLMSMSPSTSTLRGHLPGSLEEEERLSLLLTRMAALCKTRGVTFKDCYMDHERAAIPSPSRMNSRRGGKVTRPQFVRNFPFKKEFSTEDIAFIGDRFMTQEGAVHYMALHNEVDEHIVHEPQPFALSKLIVKPDDTEWSHHELHPVDKLRAKIVERRVRVYELFQDFDALRKGFVTVGQVKTVFAICGIQKDINKEEFELLLGEYLREDGMFCYTEFCRDLESNFSTYYLEKNPTAQTEMPSRGHTAPARRNMIVVTPSRRARIDAIEDRMRYRIKVRGVLMKPAFQDFDRAHRGYVTRSQFARALVPFGFELSQADLNLLCEVYCNLGNHTDVNYLDFVQSLDPFPQDLQVAHEQERGAYQPYHPTKYFDQLGRLERHPVQVM